LFQLYQPGYGKGFTEVKRSRTAEGLGAERSALVWQFLGESIIVCFIATLLGVLITLLLLPRFNMLTETSLTFTIGHQGIIWIGLLILSVVLGILSGGLPCLCGIGIPSFTDL